MLQYKLIAVPLLVISAITVGWLYLHSEQQDKTTLTLYGNIDIRQVELSFHDLEHIQHIYVQEGEQVSQKQLLAVQDLERFQYAVDIASARLEVQQQVVDQLINGSRPEEIKMAQADVKGAFATFIFAEKELERMQTLAQKKLISTETVDAARASVGVAREKLKALREQQSLQLIGPRKETILAAQAQLKADDSTLKLAQKIWHDGHLYAPQAGIIQQRILEPGDMAGAQNPVLTLALVDPVWARVYVSEQYLGQLYSGMAAQIYTDSFPGTSYSGWVGYISPTAEFTPKVVETTELRTSLVYQLRVYACNPQNQLRLGMPVTVTIALTQSEQSPEQSCRPQL